MEGRDIVDGSAIIKKIVVFYELQKRIFKTFAKYMK